MMLPYEMGYYAGLWSFPRWPNPWVPFWLAVGLSWAHGHSDGECDARPQPARRLEPECVR
jgi:hypothetical protein